MVSTRASDGCYVYGIITCNKCDSRKNISHELENKEGQLAPLHFEKEECTQCTQPAQTQECRRQRSVVTSLELCSVWKYLEIKEGRDDNTFTCTGLTDQQEVSWVLNIIEAKKCPPVPPSCHYLAYGYLNVSRTSNENYDITVLATRISDLSIFSENITCKTNTEAKLCQLDIIYPAENSTCHIEFSGETWTVTGWCSVPKLKSTRFLDKSGCYFHQTSQTAGTTAEVGFYKMNLKPSTQTGYYTGTCNMTSYLPSEGRYSYTVIIMPGQVNVSPTFTGSNEIRRPSGSLTHNCPQPVTQGADLTCQCSVSELGSPQGRLQWNITDSSQLSLTGLKREQHGENYVCSLTWNRTVQQSLTYTLIITYSPSQMNFKVNNASNNVIVEEKSPVTMLCQSDGRPTPNMTITDVTNGNRVVHSQPGGNVTLADHRVQTRYDKTTVECEDTGEYRCTADNIIDSKYQAVTLFVMCKPRSTVTSPTPPTIVEGKAFIFELIAYPNSVIVTKYFIGSNNCNSETPASDDIFSVVCSPNPQLPYKVTCTVTVIKITVNTAGLYKAVVSNNLGSVALIFEALPQNTTGSKNSDDVTSSEFSRGLGTGLGIGLGIAAAEAVGVVLVCCWRRKQQKHKGGRDNAGYSSRQNISLDKVVEPPSSSGLENEGAYEIIGNNETGQTAAYTNVEGSNLSSRKTSKKTGNVYDGLHIQDVGVSSPYASLT